MSGFNKAIIIGHLGKDPELRPVGDSSVCNFTIATSEKHKDKETTEWHRIVAWGKTAELCGQYLKKGSQVCVEGKLQTRMWEKDGTKHYATEIVAQTVTFLQKATQPAQPKRDPVQTEDEIPF